jgi:hypothetical protein
MIVTNDNLTKQRQLKAYKMSFTEAIDYRCDGAKQTAEFWATYCYQCVLDEFTIPTMPVIAPWKLPVHSKTARTVQTGL